jgi:CBS domain-containing protein
MIKAGDYMSSPVLTTSPDAFAYEAVGEMNKNNVGAFLVEAHDEYIGVFTKTDWIYKILKGVGDPNVVKVASMMTAPIITIEKDESIAKAGEIMQERKIRHIAVTDKGKIVGILSIKDLEKCWTNLK